MNMNILIIIFLTLLTWVKCFIPNPDSVKYNRRMSLFAQLGRVTMYTKESCPHCAKAKDLLESHYQLTINYVDVEDPDK